MNIIITTSSYVNTTHIPHSIKHINIYVYRPTYIYIINDLFSLIMIKVNEIDESNVDANVKWIIEIVVFDYLL